VQLGERQHYLSLSLSSHPCLKASPRQGRARAEAEAEEEEEEDESEA
jgi:hypothetical protein